MANRELPAIISNEVFKDIEKACDKIIKSGHGEVIIKIKNGAIYRILQTEDKLMV